MKNFVEELRWRGMIHDVTPDTEEYLSNNITSGYIGFDPTADSLHIGNLVQIMTLAHFQKCGHKPIILIGGVTGMIGDPSGKSKERKFLDLKEISSNQGKIRLQFEKFLNFSGNTAASIVNNNTWFNDFNLLDFLRDIGKHISINYMTSKDSVKNRLETGISYTEFTYQLIQGYDFYWLWKNKNVKIQLGGSDQWGNILTGNELIRKIGKGDSYALTTRLITKTNGGKFGKTEEGNIWLDSKRTSPYKFYQFWLNSSDEDSKNYIKIFTLKNQQEIEKLITEHDETPHLRILQKAIADEVTTRVHNKEDLKMAIKASSILFGKSTADDLKSLDEDTFLSVFEGVPQFEMSKSDLSAGILDVLAEKTQVFASKGEARRMTQSNAVSINKEKITEDFQLSENDLLNGKYILAQKGKKNYFLIIVG